MPYKTNHRFALMLLLGISLTSTAAPFTPKHNDMVIAKWPAYKKANQDKRSIDDVIANSQKMLNQATQPGESYRYSLARAMLEPWAKHTTENTDFWLSWARVQQNKHDFDNAKKSLEKVLKTEPDNKNAHLLFSRIQVIQQDYTLAEQSCNALLRSGALFLASVCKLETQSYQGDIERSYSALNTIYSRLKTNDPNTTWVVAVLAEMAVRQNKLFDGEALLDRHFNANNISYLIQWTDIKLALGKYQEVYTKLAEIVERTPNSEDALLVRLAIAETKQRTTIEKPQWKKRIAERIALREQRQDIDHASDIALYYLDIEPNAKKAQDWADINWQHAKEYKDKQLLKRAREAFNESL